MAYYSKNGSGIDSSAYIYVQLQVTRTDYPTYSHFSVKSVAVSDTGSSSFIRGQVTTNQAGNSWTAATGWKSVSYNGTTTLATATFDVTRGASDKTAHIGAYAEGGGTGIYAGGTDYAWLNVTVPKVLAPNAPTGCTATYVSDSQASVSWTNGTTDSDHPRDATLVERKDGSNDWAQVASVGGSATSYTDNGISANTQYQYRVRAKNAAGYSAYSTGVSIYTTPAAPASVTLDKTAATTVQVDVTGTWGYAVTYDVESTYDGGSTWATVATSTSLPYSATVNAGTVQFRVRAVSGALSSAWTLSASLVTVCPPLAPTIVQAPANPTAYGDGSTISWTPNHPDGSVQASAEVKVTNPGGTSTTYTVSTATSYSFTPNATGTWTAQVRTKGLDPSYGEWSQTVSWGVANPPAVVITSPATDGTDVVSLPMTVSWSVTDSTGVSAQRIIIEGSDGEILNRTLAGDVRTVALNASDVALENGQTYTIRLRVMGGSGLVTEQTRIFDVAWLAPAAPVLQLTEGEGRSATIDVMDTHYSESGSTIAVDGSAIADSFTVFGNSTQDGTPTPGAPVAIESIGEQNLLDTFISDLTTAGVTWTSDAEGMIHANGTKSGGAYAALRSNMNLVLQAGTYTLYAKLVSGTATNAPTFYLLDSSSTSIASVSANVAGSVITSTFTLTETKTAMVLRAALWTDGAVYTDATYQLWLGRGSSLSGYQPYGRVVPTTVGRNLVDSSLNYPFTFAGITYTNGSDGSVILNGTKSGGGYGVFKNGLSLYLDAGAYTFSVVRTGGTAGSVPTVYLLDGSGTTVFYASPNAVGTVASQTLTLAEPKRIYSVRFGLWTDGAVFTDATYRIQLERGSTATPYQPYDGTTTSIDLQGNALRSLPDGTRDELRVGERKVLVKRVKLNVYDGSGTITKSSSSSTLDNWKIGSSNTEDWKYSGASHNLGLTATMTNSYPVATGAFSTATGPGISVWADGTYLRTTKDLFADGTAVAAWLNANPVTVQYPLATPQEIDLGAVSDLPFIPDDGEMWVDGTTMEAVLRPADYAGQPTIQSVDVQRVNADGTAWTVATGLTVGGSCIDPLPPLGVPVTYRATSSAASGSTASGTFTETFGGRDWVLNFGNAAQEHVEFIYNPQADLSLAQGGKGYHFADGGAGKGLPVFYPTTDRDYAGTLKFDTILYGDSDKVLDLCDRYPVAWLRDPFGHRWRAHVSPSVSHGVGQVWPVTLSWDAMRFEEAWDG